MFAKQRVLTYITEFGAATPAQLADALGYATHTGAAATLLRLYRHGHLRRHRDGDGDAYFYYISDKGRMWLSHFGA